MKKLFAALFLSLTLYGCGSSSGIGGNSPGISNLVVSPSSIAHNSGGGAATLTVYVNFIDLDGDLVKLRLIDTSTQQYREATLSGTSGLTTGTAYITTIGSTATVGSYPFSIVAYDSRGNASNALNGTIVVN